MVCVAVYHSVGEFMAFRLLTCIGLALPHTRTDIHIVRNFVAHHFVLLAVTRAALLYQVGACIRWLPTKYRGSSANSELNRKAVAFELNGPPQSTNAWFSIVKLRQKQSHYSEKLSSAYSSRNFITFFKFGWCAHSWKKIVCWLGGSLVAHWLAVAYPLYSQNKVPMTRKTHQRNKHLVFFAFRQYAAIVFSPFRCRIRISIDFWHPFFIQIKIPVAHRTPYFQSCVCERARAHAVPHNKLYPRYTFV